MRYSLLAVLLVIAVLQLFAAVQVPEPADLPPLTQNNAASTSDVDTPQPGVLSHEIRTTLRTSPSHSPATQPSPPR
jgi:hypothetical protein